jgi:hypothetical protein
MNSGVKLSRGNAMRAISWLVLSFGLLIQNPGAEGQDAPRPKAPDAPAKKVEPKAIVIDEDELDRMPIVLRAGKLPTETPQFLGGLDDTIDRLIRDLEDLRREMKKTKEAAKAGGEPKPEIRPGGPGPMPGQPGFLPGASPVDQKLDMILKQMDEMRRDIKDLQNRLPAAKEKKGPATEFKGFFGPKGPMPKDNKPGFPPGAQPQPKEGEAKPDVAVQKALQYLQDRQRDEERQKGENMMLKQHIDRLLQEVEKLRNEIRKANPGK